MNDIFLSIRDITSLISPNFDFIAYLTITYFVNLSYLWLYISLNKRLYILQLSISNNSFL